MSTEVKCSLIALVGVLFSALISLLISRNEIKKMQMTWTHDHELSFDSDFKTMCSCVLNYLNHEGNQYRQIALRQVQLLQIVAPKSLSSILKDMSQQLEENNPSEVHDLLNRIIEVKNRI